MVKKHHDLDTQAIDKLREASAHAPLRCEKSDHDVHGRSNRDLTTVAAAQALATGSPSSSLLGSSKLRTASSELIAAMSQFGRPNDDFDDTNGSQSVLRKLKVTVCIQIDEFCIKNDGFCFTNGDFNANIKGVKISTRFEEPPTEVLELFKAVPHAAYFTLFGRFFAAFSPKTVCIWSEFG